MAIDVTEETYRACAPGLARLAVLLVGRDRAEDVVADAVARAVGSRSWPTVDDHEAYLYRCVINECRRRRRSLPRPVVDADLERAGSDPDSTERSAMFDAVRQLSQRQQAAIYLTYWVGLSQSETADHMGISTGSVKRHLDRAKKHLRSLLS